MTVEHLVGDARLIPSALVRSGHRDLVGTIPCIVTSPPYNVAIPNYPSGYGDHLPWWKYEQMAFQAAQSMARVLCTGGRVWLNVQQTVPLSPGEPGGDRVNLAHLWMTALAEAGLRYRDTICWVQDSFDGGCAWGSWCQPSAPNLRGSSELILLYYKDRWHRPAPKEWKGVLQPRGLLLDEDGEIAVDDDGKAIPDPDVPGGDWAGDLTRNVWKMRPANPGQLKQHAEKKDLPALFPVELPARAIRLSTWPGEWVLDPFAGHGTTGVAAERLGRHAVLVDLGY